MERMFGIFDLLEHDFNNFVLRNQRINHTWKGEREKRERVCVCVCVRVRQDI